MVINESLDANALAISKRGNGLLFNWRVALKSELEISFVTGVFRADSLFAVLGRINLLLSLLSGLGINMGLSVSHGGCKEGLRKICDRMRFDRRFIINKSNRFLLTPQRPIKIALVSHLR